MTELEGCTVTSRHSFGGDDDGHPVKMVTYVDGGVLLKGQNGEMVLLSPLQLKLMATVLGWTVAAPVAPRPVRSER